ncbi:radical SAM/SPASM domain-containing protein [Stackebrandtia nassauensis]|uniref:Radical SAM domain protein n=1 Tax=Stackebrandtia nassauensis (strain DSM 44728 / CIP 108903 / NRRL B-16338 / NBRC 102104 / LLR-40K-21) TaxID=446470 RepID=D3PXV5_STANL|nr:radical SAM protein [Stackebrandtia nassauensis]ADD45284.1 Radical SAM domain protein [Stackebrandtia nassauensis DSM 44728]
MTTVTYGPSKYVSFAFDNDGALIVQSTRTGAIGVVPSDKAEDARKALLPGSTVSNTSDGILKDLKDGGFLVPSTMDEDQLVHDRYIKRYQKNRLDLILMPTEQCNFRCVYCYESFIRGEMSPELVAGLHSFIAAEHRVNGLESLNVSWFGGEPLLAADLVLDTTRSLADYCRANGIASKFSATTNGYLLKPGYAEKVVQAGVRHFQITLDGTKHDHDKRRVDIDGAETFDVIMANLRHLKSTDLDFTIMLRHNFDPEGLRRLDDYIDMIQREFSDDPRYTTHFAAIGKWGGAKDDDLVVCEGRTGPQAIAHARGLAISAGFKVDLLENGLKPEGSICYAADPRSFVIGSDGTVYKCTVELDYHERNMVGKLHPDGTMDLDWRKLALWCETDGTDPGKKCNSCYFGGACHGAACPKEWMDEDDCHCPPSKQVIRETLPLVRRNFAAGVQR